MDWICKKKITHISMICVTHISMICINMSFSLIIKTPLNGGGGLNQQFCRMNKHSAKRIQSINMQQMSKCITSVQQYKKRRISLSKNTFGFPAAWFHSNLTLFHAKRHSNGRCCSVHQLNTLGVITRYKQLYTTHKCIQ